MNVLLTCAGRRNYLVRFFQNALGKRGQVIACDASSDAPALLDADKPILVPTMADPDYFPTLLSLCIELKVRLIVSVNELELAGLASHAERFRAIGTIPVVGSPQSVATCQDKWAAFKWMRAHGIPTPQTYLTLADVQAALAQAAIRYPLLLKPRWGTSSIGILTARNERELALAYEWGTLQLDRTIFAGLNDQQSERCFVFQECLDGQEYGMDVVNDLNGRYVATLARRKLAMRAGNTDRAVTVNEPRLESLGRTLGQQLRHAGSIDCDVMATSEGFFVVDINPRLGGGYPFSHLAGADLPAALIAWGNGEEPDEAWLRSRPGVVSSRFDGMVIVDHGDAAPCAASLRAPADLLQAVGARTRKQPEFVGSRYELGHE